MSNLRRIYGRHVDPVDMAQDPFMRRRQGIYTPGLPWVHHMHMARWYEHKIKTETWEKEHGCSIHLLPDGQIRYVSWKHGKIVMIPSVQGNRA